MPPANGTHALDRVAPVDRGGRLAGTTVVVALLVPCACGLTGCTTRARAEPTAPSSTPSAVRRPSATRTPTASASPAPPQLVLRPDPADGPVVYGPHSGVGSTTYPFGSFTISYSSVLSIDVVCTGGGQLTVLATSSFDSHPDTVVCDGRPAPVAQFPSDYFPGAIHLGVAGLAGQRWTVLAQAGP